MLRWRVIRVGDGGLVLALPLKIHLAFALITGTQDQQ
jgi:hypothetical protein